MYQARSAHAFPCLILGVLLQMIKKIRHIVSYVLPEKYYFCNNYRLLMAKVRLAILKGGSFL